MVAAIDRMAVLDVRLRGRIAKEELREKIGRVLAPSDISFLVWPETRRAVRVLKPNGDPLLVYIPRAIPEEIADAAYPILTKIRLPSRNRGEAAGSKTVKVGNTTYSKQVKSGLLGSIEGKGARFPVCRTTAWTGQHTEQFRALYPFFQHVAGLFAAQVPDRFDVQMGEVDKTEPDWVIEGTPFTTVTVNNTYPTGVHQDAGDLKEGFSCLAVLRRGEYTGGNLCFPEFEVGMDLQDRDVVLMDAHEWHGNTAILDANGIALEEPTPEAERISTVLYMRSNLVSCGSASSELKRARDRQTL